MWELKVADDFMRRELVTLAPETDIYDGVSRLLDHNISGAPVTDSEGNYLGVFSQKCSMKALTEPVEVAEEMGLPIPRVRNFMKCELFTVSPKQDVFEAIDDILARRISGAPVIAETGEYLGVFSEKTAMRVLVAAIHDQCPGSQVGSYMNVDPSRLISDDQTLLEVAHKFQQTPLRRLPVLNDGKLAGQVSRRDVLKAEMGIAEAVVSRVRAHPDRWSRIAQASEVGQYMDTAALTIGPHTDILGIAQLFLNSPYRRLPVIEGKRVIGQVSRRDVLEQAAAVLRPDPGGQGEKHKAETLYLSPLHESAPPSLG